MSDYECFYNATNPDKECGWYWRVRYGSRGWIEHGPFNTVDEARADATMCEEVGKFLSLSCKSPRFPI
jgi:hypothetical protein